MASRPSQNVLYEPQKHSSKRLFASSQRVNICPACAHEQKVEKSCHKQAFLVMFLVTVALFLLLAKYHRTEGLVVAILNRNGCYNYFIRNFTKVIFIPHNCLKGLNTKMYRFQWPTGFSQKHCFLFCLKLSR